MSDGLRAVPTTDVAHPMADLAGPPGPDQWVATESRAPVVALTQARSSLLAMAERDRRRPVLVTDATSTLTPLLANVWQRRGGSWIVREVAGGLRNGFTGRALERFEDAWRLGPPSTPDAVALNHLRPFPAQTVGLTVVLSTRHPARGSTVLGEAAQRVAQADPARRPTLAWGGFEPVGLAWDRSALTAAVLGGGPARREVLVAAEGVSTLVSAHRTTRGLEELTHAYLDVGPRDLGELGADQQRVAEVLARLCTTTMPLVGMVWARPALRDLRVAPFLTPPAVPLLLLIGAPAVRSFGIDVPDLAARFDARVVGRPRLPALLFDLARRPEQAWTRLDEILGTLDPDRLADALGLVAQPLAAARPRRTGSVDAQP